MVIPVSVAFDSAWTSVFGSRASDEARSAVASSSAVYAPYCFEFQVVQTTLWNPREVPGTIHELYGDVATELSHRKGRFLVYLTGHTFQGSVDGLAGDDDAIVEYHPNDPHMDVVVTAHELGHLLGFYNNSVSCGCLMDPSGTTTVLSTQHADELIAAADSDSYSVNTVPIPAHTSTGR